MGLDLVVVGLLVAAVGVVGYPYADAFARQDRKFSPAGGWRVGDVEPERWRVKMYRGVLVAIAFGGLLLAGIGLTTAFGGI